MLPCCIKQIATSHFSSLCFVPQLDKHFCKCYKMGPYPFRPADASFMCREDAKWTLHWGDFQTKTTLSEICGFRYHEKPQVLLDLCPVQKTVREKTVSYPTSCFLLLPPPQQPKIFLVLRTRQSNRCMICLGPLFLFPLSLAMLSGPEKGAW